MFNLKSLVIFAQLSALTPTFWLAQARQPNEPITTQSVEPTDRERIKAAREKADREMKADTARPWHGQDWGSGRVLRSQQPQAPVK